MAGLHVVRGRQGNLDDGRIGAIGTIARFKKDGDNMEINVTWPDDRTSHVIFPAHLELLDTNSLGVSHPSTVCDVCKEVNILGFVWKCVHPGCNKLLCSKCYHGDRHNLRHPFERVDMPGSPGMRLGKRQNYTRVKLSGPKRYDGRPFYIDHLPSIWEWQDINRFQDKVFSDAEPVYDSACFLGIVPVTSTAPIDEHNPAAHYQNEEAQVQAVSAENAYQNTAALRADSNPYMNDAARDSNPYINEGTDSSRKTSTELSKVEKKALKKAQKSSEKTPSPSSPIDDEIYDDIEHENASKTEKTKGKEGSGKGKGSRFSRIFSKKTDKKTEKTASTDIDSGDYVIPVSHGTVISPDTIYDHLEVSEDMKITERRSKTEVEETKTVTIVSAYSPRGNPDELTVSPGDRVYGVTQSEPGWLKGTLNGKTGYFPVSTVKEADVPKLETRTAPNAQRPLPSVPGQIAFQASKRISNPVDSMSHPPRTDPLPAVPGPATRRDSSKSSTPVSPTSRTPRTDPLPAVPGPAMRRNSAKSSPQPDPSRQLRVSDEHGPTMSEARNVFGATTKSGKVEKPKPPEPKFKKDDKVCLTTKKEDVKRLQQAPRTPFDDLEDVLGKDGVVADVHKSGDVFVKFESLYTRVTAELLSPSDTSVVTHRRRPLSMQLQGKVNRMVNREGPSEDPM